MGLGRGAVKLSSSSSSLNCDFIEVVLLEGLEVLLKDGFEVVAGGLKALFCGAK